MFVGARSATPLLSASAEGLEESVESSCLRVALGGDGMSAGGSCALFSGVSLLLIISCWLWSMACASYLGDGELRSDACSIRRVLELECVPWRWKKSAETFALWMERLPEDGVDEGWVSCDYEVGANSHGYSASKWSSVQSSIGAPPPTLGLAGRQGWTHREGPPPPPVLGPSQVSVALIITTNVPEARRVHTQHRIHVPKTLYDTQDKRTGRS